MSSVFREGTNPVWGAFMMAWVLGALGASFYWLFTESGPVGWLADWQAQNLFNGEWYPKITALLVMLALIAPLFLIKLAVEAITGKRMTAPTQ